MEENKNKNKKKPRYDYNDYTDSSGYKYNKISILEAIVQSYRVITDEGDDNSLSSKDRGNNNMEIGGYIKNYEGFNISKALEFDHAACSDFVLKEAICLNPFLGKYPAY